MVVIRFRRVGLKRQPSYRIVVTDKRKARDGKELEVIGHHNPRTRPSTDIIDEERALYWLSVGAQPSDAVRRVMERTGTMERFQRLRGGEEIEALVQEAQKAAEEAPEIDPRTAYLAPAPGEGKGPRAQERAGVQIEATETVEEVVDDVAEAADEAVDEVAEAAEDVTEDAEAVAEEVVEDAAEAVEDVEETVDSAADEVDEVVDEVANDAAEAAEDVADAAEDAVEAVEETVEEAADEVENAVTGDDEEDEK
jgi:small subunit ribosomal protein S16